MAIRRWRSFANGRGGDGKIILLPTTTKIARALNGDGEPEASGEGLGLADGLGGGEALGDPGKCGPMSGHAIGPHPTAHIQKELMIAQTSMARIPKLGEQG